MNEPPSAPGRTDWQRVVRIADSWWARDFPGDPPDLRPPATRVQSHQGALIGNGGIWILAVGPFPVISVPPPLLPEVAARAGALTRTTIADEPSLRAAFAPAVIAKVIGPAFIGYAPRDHLAQPPPHPARPLGPDDAGAVAGLAAATAPDEWEEGSSDATRVPTFGAFDEAGELCALAGYETWGPIAHISIVTAPHRRRRGFGAAAFLRAAYHALEAGLLPQYRCLLSNTASRALAARLGFRAYGLSVYLRPVG